VEVFTNIVSVSGYKALKINYIIAFIRPFDALHFNRSSDLNALSIRLVNYFIDFYVKSICHFDHLFVKLFGGNDGLLIIDSAVLCETAQITVVENAWDDGLADHSAAFEVDQACS